MDRRYVHRKHRPTPTGPVPQQIIDGARIYYDPPINRKCRICGCTDDDCRRCIEISGEPCFWVLDDLCSVCACGILPPEQDPQFLARIRAYNRGLLRVQLIAIGAGLIGIACIVWGLLGGGS